MPIERILEPEVMSDPDEARDYDAMDHARVNRSFCADLVAQVRIGLEGDEPARRRLFSRMLDVGTGSALIPIELCRLVGAARVTGVDLADSMLELAARNVRAAGLEDRVALVRADAKDLPFAAATFTCVISNTIVHHVPEPRVALAEMARVLAPGGLLFVRDLARPDSHAEVDALVSLHAKEATPAQRELLRASLFAALTLEETVELASELGLVDAAVEMTSDRHWTLVWDAPAA